MKTLKLTLFVFLTLGYSALSCSQPMPSAAPVSESYLIYLSTPPEQRQNIYGCVIPEKYDNVVKADFNHKNNRDLPPEFDLRTTDMLTPIRNQGGSNACWCFSCMAALESNWLMKSLGTYDLSENNMYYGHGYEGLHIGGNRAMATSYMVRGDGPVLESEDPFQYDAGFYHEGFTPTACITEGLMLPQGLEIETIKQLIYDQGALSAAIYYSNSYYISPTHTYYFPGYANANTNHLVNLVGWIDSLQTPGGVGAWIVRNSWGQSWGENGYFYVSYNDYFINKYLALWTKREPYNPLQSILQYDELGIVWFWGFNSDTANMLVKFDVPAGKSISRVGTWTTSSPSIVSFKLYNHFNGGAVTDLICQTAVDTLDYFGYYVISLPAPITFDADTTVYLKGEFITPGFGYPLPTEGFEDGWANPQISSGAAWISIYGEDYSWIPVGAGTSAEIDFCVKLYLDSHDSIEDNVASIPSIKAYPNPFRQLVTLKIDNLASAPVNLDIYNLKGQLIRSFTDFGGTNLIWDSKDMQGNTVSNGIYLMRLRRGQLIEVQKVVKIK